MSLARFMGFPDSTAKALLTYQKPRPMICLKGGRQFLEVVKWPLLIFYVYLLINTASRATSRTPSVYIRNSEISEILQTKLFHDQFLTYEFQKLVNFCAPKLVPGINVPHRCIFSL